jgi:RNA polymerase sigma-70 factor (ECF subfamily)
MRELTAGSALYETASATWPAEWVPRKVFIAYVLERVGHGVGDEQPPPAAIAALYLACACVRGVAPALEAFESHCVPTIQRAGGRVGLRSDQVSELVQRLREDLLVGRAGAAPSLGKYGGRGDLGGWLRVTATREAIRMKKRADGSGDSEIDRLEARATGDDPELSYIKALYRDAFRAAFRVAALGLDAREKKVLYQHTVEGMNIDELGAAHGVHRATAARWIQSARENLFAGVRRELAQKLNVSPKELQSIIRLVESHLEVTMKRLLT